MTKACCWFENHMTDKNNNDRKVTLLNSTTTEYVYQKPLVLFLFNNLLYTYFFPDRCTNDFFQLFFIVYQNQKKKFEQQSIFEVFRIYFCYVVVK